MGRYVELDRRKRLRDAQTAGKNTDQAGKDDSERPVDYSKYSSGYDRIDWSKK